MLKFVFNARKALFHQAGFFFLPSTRTEGPPISHSRGCQIRRVRLSFPSVGIGQPVSFLGLARLFPARPEADRHLQPDPV